LFVASITQHNVTMPASPSEINVTFLNRIRAHLPTNGRPQSAAEFGWFCPGEPWNFANWPAEFGKIFRRKLWALVMIFRNVMIHLHVC